MSKASEVLTQLVSTLGDDSTLQTLLGGAGRVFIRDPEKARTIPAITLWLIDDSRAAIDEDKEWTLRVQLDIWETSWGDCFRILDRVDALLVDQTFSQTNYKALTVRREGAHQILTDEEVDGIIIKQLSTEYLFRVVKTA